MCFPHDAHPPIPAIAGAAVDTEDLVLEAADGTKFAAFAARAQNPSGAGMVVMPDVRGLFTFYEELALRFAEQGINAVTIDYFGRTAGVSKRNDPQWNFMEHVGKTHPDTIAQDTAAAVAYLRAPAGGSCTSVFTVGFCFGGSNSWNQAAAGHGLAGAIGFYGHPGRVIQDMLAPGTPHGIAPTIERVPQIDAPIMALQAGADQMITQADTDAFKAALDKQRIENDFKTYPGAPHSFFDRTYEEHAEASADAWQRILGFVAKHRA
ncbi:MAG: dienelactone hydrolase family protein [Dehalococcoidia bacterium]